jgi:hypothetical protein
MHLATAYCGISFGSYVAQAQYFKISGKITNDKLEPLALVSIQVKGSVKGTISKEDGTYQLHLEEGTYDLAFQHAWIQNTFDKCCRYQGLCTEYYPGNR